MGFGPSSREGGALIPTVVFGVPASAGMAILLGAFLMHGLVPGPDMVTKNLDITYSMVWSIAIANLLGSGLCFAFSGHFAKLATLRYTLVLPVVLCLVYIGAFEGKREWGDLYSLLFFGCIGWLLKHLKWPRPPLVLGFILGSMIERYLFISIQRYGGSWMLRPAVIIIFLAAAWSLLRPLVSDLRSKRRTGARIFQLAKPQFRLRQLFPVFLLALFATMMFQALQWDFDAKVVPAIVGTGALVFCSLALLHDIFAMPGTSGQGAGGASASAGRTGGHMDISGSLDHLPRLTIAFRGARFFGWMLVFLAGMAVIGVVPTVPLFILAFMRLEGREPWRVVLPMVVCMTVLIYLVFDRFLAITWPQTVVGTLFPILKHYIPSI